MKIEQLKTIEGKNLTKISGGVNFEINKPNLPTVHIFEIHNPNNLGTLNHTLTAITPITPNLQVGPLLVTDSHVEKVIGGGVIAVITIK